MSKHDRRAIEPLLRPHFPALPAGMTSDEWQGFLNEQTGLDIPLDEPNASAFDKWRQALAKQGLPVWNYTPARLAKIKADGVKLKAHVDKLKAEEAARLAALAKEAPMVTAKELLK